MVGEMFRNTPIAEGQAVHAIDLTPAKRLHDQIAHAVTHGLAHHGRHRYSGVVRSDSTYVWPSTQLSTDENSAALPPLRALSTAWVK